MNIQTNKLLKTELNTYGVRQRINLRMVGVALIVICILTPCTNILIPAIYKKCKGEVYI